MKVILKENIENLGKRGDVVHVAPGYGRNYLIPKKLALEITPSNLKMIEMEQRALRKKYEKERMSHQTLIDKINETRLTFVRKTAEKDVIFGSVGAADIAEALMEKEIEVDRKKILLDENIKRLGNYTVPIKIFHEERAEVKIEVIGEEEALAREKQEKPQEGKEEVLPEEKKEEVETEEPEGRKEQTEKDSEEKTDK
ncbi:MAG: 50S ribosomal protein L9 [Candidatus Aminicenantales bacterium]